MSWRVTALWTEPAPPGRYSRAGGEPLEVSPGARVFDDLDAAKRYRAQLLQQHPTAEVYLNRERERPWRE